MRGLSRYEKVTLALAALFLVVCGGYFLSQRVEERGVWVITAKTPQASESTSVPADGEEWPESLLPGEVIDLNTAPATDLARLPQIGKKRAADIVAWREQNGPFQTTEDLMQVSGIGEGTYEAVKEYITVTGTD